MNKSLTRIISGHQAKRRGDAFEHMLNTAALRNNWTAIRIPDGCKQVSGTKLIRVKSPFDFIFLKDKNAIFADAKTTKKKAFQFSSMTPHQVRLLKEIYKQGFKAGYIINYTEFDSTVFYNGLQLVQKGQGSLSIEEGLRLGDNITINLDRIFAGQQVTHRAIVET